MADKHGYFTEGSGNRGFDMPERGPIEADPKKRQAPVLIDLENLDKAGKGPVNFARRNGAKLTVGSGEVGAAAAIKE